MAHTHKWKCIYLNWKVNQIRYYSTSSIQYCIFVIYRLRCSEAPHHRCQVLDENMHNQKLWWSDQSKAPASKDIPVLQLPWKLPPVNPSAFYNYPSHIWLAALNKVMTINRYWLVFDVVHLVHAPGLLQRTHKNSPQWARKEILPPLSPDCLLYHKPL